MDTSLPDALRSARARAGLSLAEVARRIVAADGGDPEGMRVQLCLYESGTRRPMEGRVLAILAAVNAPPDVRAAVVNAWNAGLPRMAAS